MSDNHFLKRAKEAESPDRIQAYAAVAQAIYLREISESLKKLLPQDEIADVPESKFKTGDQVRYGEESIVGTVGQVIYNDKTDLFSYHVTWPSIGTLSCSEGRLSLVSS